ncbi:MAG: hypothetical protein M1812_006112 [Candelaria pacifica]|nr:MAG: hypothetical protein M1812_006112 [Candelaria pacifica]
MEGGTTTTQGRRPIIQMDEIEGDGLSLYRSLSRQLNGDPHEYVSVLNAVLDHFLRVWIQADHPRHQEYKAYSISWPDRPVKTFFGAISCPDLIAGAGPRIFEQVLWVIANALSIRLVIWTSVPHGPSTQPLHRVGMMTFPEYHVFQSGPHSLNGSYRHGSLVEDESGKALIAYMHHQKRNSDLEVKEICWYGKSPNVSEFECYNEYRPLQGQHRPALPGRIDFLWVFAVSVKDSTQIRIAVQMINEALRRAPGQETRRLHTASGRHLPLRRYVSVDAEFKWVRLTEEDLDHELAKVDDEREKEQIRAGNPEHLCSVLTIAIDRHAIFNFHILDMLENATSTTVSNVSPPCLSTLSEL